MKHPDSVHDRPSLLKKCNTPAYSHWKLLLYWPVFGILFALVERGDLPVTYHPVHAPLDDRIPFCEFFLFAYLFWFVFLIGMLAYTFFCDPSAFRKMMWFIILTYSVTMAVYFLYPTCQELRPVEFPRDNALTRFVRWFYAFDTNTNVCPSLHVIGSVAVVVGAWYSRRFSTPGWKAAFLLVAALISASTVFLKQHSVVDVAAAVPVCVLGWWAVRHDFTKKFQKTR